MCSDINFNRNDVNLTESEKAILALVFDEENITDENTSLDSPYVYIFLLTILLIFLLLYAKTNKFFLILFGLLLIFALLKIV